MSRKEVSGIVAFFAICVGFAPVRTENTNSSPGTSLYRTIITCSEGDTFGCLKDKTVNLIYAAVNREKIPIWNDAIALVKSKDINQTNLNDTGRSFSDGLDNFLDSHQLQLTLPRFSSILASSEGKGKKNRGYGLIALTIAGALMAAGMAALAAMAGKALAASMAALAVATLAAMRKGGHGHGGHSSYEVISLPASHHHRSFLDQLNGKPASFPEQDPYNFEPMDDVK